MVFWSLWPQIHFCRAPGLRGPSCARPVASCQPVGSDINGAPSALAARPAASHLQQDGVNPICSWHLLQTPPGLGSLPPRLLATRQRCHLSRAPQQAGAPQNLKGPAAAFGTKQPGSKHFQTLSCRLGEGWVGRGVGWGEGPMAPPTPAGGSILQILLEYASQVSSLSRVHGPHPELHGGLRRETLTPGLCPGASGSSPSC